MQEFFSHKGGYVALIFIAVFALPMVAGIVGYFWYKIRRDELLASLKRDMLDRGMSAEEIQRVIEAGTPSPSEVDQTIARLLGGSPAPPR